MNLLRIGLLTFVFALCSLAQQAPEDKPEEAKPSDVRATPRGAIFGFLHAAREAEYRRAASFIDLQGLRRNADPADLARQLKEVLDRKLTSDPGRLNNTAEGNTTDGLDPRYELLGTVDLNGRPVDLLLERVTRGEGEPIWLISSSTAALIPTLHRDVEDHWIEPHLPSWMLVPGPFDSAAWQWLALLLLAALAYAFARLFSGLLTRMVSPIVRRTPTDLDDELIGSIAGPMRMLIGLAVVRAAILWIEPSILLRTYLHRILTSLFYFAVAWLALRFIDILATKAIARMTGRHRASATSVIPLLRRTGKAAIIVFAILAMLGSWGFNTTALLAGLGVGGLAIALAAQKTIENLFGGVAITTDKPILIGDFCRYGDRFGVIEDIGLRSTRIRTLERTLVTVPNGQFSGLEIENYGQRDKIWFHPILRLRVDTTPAQMRQLIEAFRSLLLATPKVDPNPARVRFIGIGDYSLNVEIFAYVLTTNFDEFLVVQEELLLGIMDAIERAGTRLALPAQLNYDARDKLTASIE